MTEPNMEWEEDFQEFFGNTTDPNKFTEFLSFREVKDFIRQAISEAEIHGFCNAQNGYAEVVKKLSDDVEKAEQRGYEKGVAAERRRIVAGLYNGFEEYMVKKADVLSLIHDNK